MTKETLLSAFTELPNEFELEALLACLRQVKKLEQDIEASKRHESITSDEIKEIIRVHFKLNS